MVNIMLPDNSNVKLTTTAQEISSSPLDCRWLAHDIGLPLEAHAEATRGWDIASLARGIKGLSRHHAIALGLFARSAADHTQD